MSQKINLDVTPGLFKQVLHVHQGDVGRQFEIAVVTRDGYEIPSGATFKIEATKPSGMGFSVTGTASGNVITFTTTTEMTDEAGNIPAQLRITSEDTVIFASNFLMSIEANAHPDWTIDGDMEHPEIKDLDQAITIAVDNWLDAHPEATTTVQDDSLTTVKYKNGSVTNEKLSDDVADCFVENVTYEKYRISETDCYVVLIPLNDTEGNIIEPYMAYSETETPAEYARNNGTTFTCNGTLNLLKSDNTWQVPNVLSRGEIIFSSNFSGTPVANDAKYLSINQDRSFTEYPIETTASQLQSSGAYNVFTTYYKLVENGQALDLSDVTGNEDDRVTSKNPNLAIGIKADKTIVIFACDGRTASDAGLTSDDVSSQMVDLGCQNAWMLDGGGSTSLNYQCSKLNRNIDSGGTADRRIRFTFNIKKENVNDFIIPAFAKIGEEKQNVIQQIIPYVNQSLISSSTTENVLDYAVNYKGSFKILYYLGDDYSWLPNKDSAFKYGMFVIEKHYGGVTRVTASSNNGRIIATNVWRYDTKAWSGWLKLGHIENGITPIGSNVPANGTSTKTIYIDNPLGATNYTVLLSIEGTSWIIPFVSGKGATYFTVNLRNLYTSATGESANIHWAVVY